MTMEEYNSILMWQNLFKEIHPQVEEQLIALPFVYLKNVDKCRIEIDMPNEVRVIIKKYGGLKGFYYNLMYKNKDKSALSQLKKSIEKWMPFVNKADREKVPVKMFWESNS